MAHRGTLDEDAFRAIARRIGLDMAAFEKAWRSRSAGFDEVLDKSLALARALDISGTPAFIIGDEMVPGVASGRTLKELVARARGATRTGAAPSTP